MMARELALLLLLLPAAVLSADTCDKADLVVAIDIGHTPRNAGATSARGRPEYQFNKVLAGELLDALRVGGFSRAVLINAEGNEIGLTDRTAMAAALKADLLLSIHHDSVQQHYLSTWTVSGEARQYGDRFRGYSLFYSGKNPRNGESLRLAQRLGEALRGQGLKPTLHHAEDIPGENRPLVDADNGVYRFDDLVVLKTATMPAVLLEAGVIVHREEERLLRTPGHRRKLIDAVQAALDQHCAVATVE